MTPPVEVVITGAGVVSPIGIGLAPFRQALATGTSGVRRLEIFDTPDFPVRIGGTVVNFDPKEFVMPRKSLKVMSRSIQLAFAAGQMAAVEAGVATPAVDPDRFGVVYGADWIQVEPDELANSFRPCATDGKFDYTRWDERAISELYPLWMLKYLPNMPGCHIAIAQDARGPNNTVVLAEASSLLAMAEGARVIERNLADVMIVGGTGSRVHPLDWMFRTRVLQSPRYEEPERVSRPFDQQRDGMVFGEGTAALVFENRQHAESRGAKILARVLSFSSRYEHCKPGEPFEGTAIRASIVESLRAAGLEPSDIGHVNAHGLSTLHHDRAEARAIRDTLGDVPVTAFKSYFGNLGAGAGAVETLGSLLAFESGEVAPTLNYEHPDPTCPINVVRAQPLSVARKTALVLNHTTMGQAVAMVLSAEV